MGAGEPERQSRTVRGTVVIALALTALAAASVSYLGPWKPGRSTLARPSPSPSTAAELTPISMKCPATEMAFTSSSLHECASVGPGRSCIQGSWTFLMRGVQHDFLVYIEMDGAYHGPGSYALVPWHGAALDARDGVAKVAVREYVSGTLWESSAGSLTVDDQGSGGWLYAGFGASQDSPVQVELNVVGWWSCS